VESDRNSVPVTVMATAPTLLKAWIGFTVEIVGAGIVTLKPLGNEANCPSGLVNTTFRNPAGTPDRLKVPVIVVPLWENIIAVIFGVLPVRLINGVGKNHVPDNVNGTTALLFIPVAGEISDNVGGLL
jgi:hypothetical protein